MSDKRVIEVDDDEAERVLAATRHREQMGALKGIATLLSKPQVKDDGVVNAIQKNTESIQDIISAIKQIPVPEKPEVNVQVSQMEIVNSLQNICDKIIESNERVIEALNKRIIVDEFKIERDQWGNMKTIKVVYQTGMLNVKSKYQA